MGENTASTETATNTEPSQARTGTSVNTANVATTANTEVLLTEIRDLNKKQLFWKRISTCCVGALALAVIIALIIVVPSATSTLGHINDTALKAQESLEDVDTMTASILDASENLNKLVDDNGETLTNAVQSLADIDFEGLNNAIQDLQDAIGPFASFMNRFR